MSKHFEAAKKNMALSFLIERWRKCLEPSGSYKWLLSVINCIGDTTKNFVYESYSKNKVSRLNVAYLVSLLIN